MANSKYKIFVAEDDHFLRKVYQTKLTQEGFMVEVAVDGEEALKKIRQNKPDLLLLDLVMPKLNGFDVLEEMGKDPELKKIPVIVLSNLGQSEDIQRTRDLGAKDYLVKANFSINEVVAKIRGFLEKYANKPMAASAPIAKPTAKPKVDAVVKALPGKCPHCRHTIPKDAKFCPYCGEKI